MIWSVGQVKEGNQRKDKKQTVSTAKIIDMRDGKGIKIQVRLTVDIKTVDHDNIFECDGENFDCV